MSLRPIKRLIKSKPTIEGAGVHLRRAFGFGNTSDFDPFLLLDDFRNDVPEDYLSGFPWHPHRGIETITYVLAGTVEHGDSMGNRGVIASGDVQWMTAGSGIIHQEMPKGDRAGRMHGFQLWANLPSSLKMTAPRYQEVKALDIPEIESFHFLVSRRGHLERRWKIGPKLESMHPSRPVALGHLLMDDPAACSHPLHVARGDHTAIAHAVAVLDRSRQYIGDGFDATMRMP